MKKHLLTYMLLLHCATGYAQNKYDFMLDSLALNAKNRQGKELSAKPLNDQVGAMLSDQIPRDKEKLRTYINYTIQVADRLKETPELARANYYLGKFFIASGGGYSEAIPPLLTGISLYEQIQDSLGIARCYMQLGLIGYLTQYFEDGIKNFNLSLQYANYPTSRYLKAITFTEMEKYREAKREFLQAIADYKERKDTASVNACFMYLGDLYTDEGKFDSAYFFLDRAITTQKKLNSLRELTRPYALLSKYFLKLNQVDSAKYYAEQALLGCTDGYDVLSAMLSSETLSQVFEIEGDYKQAFHYLQRYNGLKYESVQGSTKQKIAEMQSMFDFERKMHAEALRHEEEMRQENRTKNVFLISSLFVLLVAGGLWSRLLFVRRAKAALQNEKNVSESLLLNILPEEIAQELKEKGKTEARNFDMVSILFTDFKEFTQTSEKLSAAELVDEINHCFEAFDGIIEKSDIEKIKTIGDAYMAAGGLPIPSDEAARNTVLAALEMQEFIKKRKAELDALGKPAFEMRVGIHTGPVVAGIVGVKKFQYDIWGDTVNTASRMESAGEVAKVNISQVTYDLLKEDKEFTFESRGKIEVKGKGEMEMWFVTKS